MEPAQQLEAKVNLHVEIMKSIIAEIAIKERVVGDLVKCLGLGVFQAIVKAEVIAQKPPFGNEFRLQPGSGVGFGTTEIERVLDVPFHESEVDQDVVQNRVGLEHEQVVGDMDVKVVENLQRPQDLVARAFPVEVAESVFRVVLDAQKHAEKPQLVQ